LECSLRRGCGPERALQPVYNLVRMSQFQLWAQPWWVNLLILIPLAAFFSFQRAGQLLGVRQLVCLTIFAAAFGFVEASVVVYLRAAAGLLPAYTGSLAELRRSPEIHQQTISVSQLPQSLVTIEVYREAATLIMLATVALLAAGTTRERWAAFLWAFAFWDIFYYVGLWTTIRWPKSLKDLDVLFLIPVPWIAQVWFPLLVSSLTILVITVSCLREYSR
jgi:hypothetical protein